jgi:hypothetical protein
VQILRARQIAALLMAGTLALSFSNPSRATDIDPQWLEQARAACLPRDGDRCDDLEHLRAHYDEQALAARRAAQRAATRSNRDEMRARHEVLLQYAGACDAQVKQHCANGGCSSRAAQICLSLQQRAAACRQQAKTFCAQQKMSDCSPALARCPSDEKQNIDTILARYDDLTPAQKGRIRQLAAQLDSASDAGTINRAIHSLLNLLGL